MYAMETQSNTVNILPEVFLNSDDPDFSGLFEPLRADSRWVDSIANLSLYVGKTIPQALNEFEQMLQVEKDPDRRAVLLGAIARGYNSQMKLARGAQLLGYAWKLLDGRENDHAAFVLLEMVRFLIITGNRDSALFMLNRVPRHSDSEYIQRMAQYYQLALEVAHADHNTLIGLRKSAEWFEQREQIPTVVAHYRMMARIHLSRGNNSEAEALYHKGMQIASTPETRFALALLYNDSGNYYFQQGQSERAYKQLYRALNLAENPYSRIDTLDLLGRFLMEEKKYHEAEKWLAEGLEIAVAEGTVIIVPALALYLAECHEQLGNLDAARLFYQRASSAATELLASGFPVTDTRLRAIRSAIRFLSEHHPQIAADAGNHADSSSEDPFSFIAEHTLKEIRTIFQYALLEETRERFGNRQEAIEYLQLALRTADNVKRRYREIGSPKPAGQIAEFIARHHNLDWKKINQKFNDQLLLRLFEETGGNRKLMSEMLGVSYPHLSAQVSRALKRSEDETERKNDVSND